MKITLNSKKKINLNVKKCNAFMKFKGLMFCHSEKAKILLFDFDKPMKMPIHSFFVFFPFIAVWLDDKNKVIDFKKVKPFTCFVVSKKAFHKLLEIPINHKYERLVKFFITDGFPKRFK